MIRAACTADNKYGCATLATLQGYADDCDNEARCSDLCTIGIYKGCNKVAAEALDGRNGVAKNPARALQLYKKACDGGDGAGCNGLGFIYAKGNGVPRDLAQAQTYLQKGCDAHLDTACNNLVGIKCINEAKAPGSPPSRPPLR